MMVRSGQRIIKPFTVSESGVCGEYDILVGDEIGEKGR